MDVPCFGCELWKVQVGLVGGTDDGTIGHGDGYRILSKAFVHDGCIERSEMMRGTSISYCG